MSNTETKLCGRCQQVKPRSEFRVRAAARDGLQTYCKACQKKYNAYRPRKSEKVLEPIGITRVCTKCEEEKDLSQFAFNKARRRHSQCRSCISKYWAEYSKRRAG